MKQHSKLIIVSLVCVAIIIGAIFFAISTQPKDQNTVTISVINIDGNIDPLFYNHSQSSYIYDFVFGFLTDFDAKKIFKKGLTNVEISSDKLTYTFKIDEDALYSNGDKVEAQDFEFAITVTADESYYGALDFSNLNIVGYDDFKEGKTDSIRGVFAQGDTLKITIDQPDVNAIYNMKIPAINKKYYGKYYENGNVNKLRDAMKDKIIGSGPYVVKKYRENKDVLLERDGKSLQDGFKVKYIKFIPSYNYDTEKSTLYDDLIAKRADFVSMAMDPEFVKSFFSIDHLEYYMYPTDNITYIVLNQESSHLIDVNFRKALMHAIDRKSFVSQYLKQGAELINAPIPISSDIVDMPNLYEYEYDLDKAEEYLRLSGCEKGDDEILYKDGKKVVVSFASDAQNDITVMFFDQFEKNLSKLGIMVIADYIDYDTVVQDLESGQLEMFMLASPIEPNLNPYELFHTDGNINYSSYSNKKVDALLDQIKKTQQVPYDKELMHELWVELNKDLPVLFLYSNSDMFVYSNALENLDFNNRYNFSSIFKNVSIKR